MRFLRKHSIGTLLLVIIIVFASLHIFYYEHTGSPGVLAAKLVRQERPAKDCFLFRTFDFWFRPTTYELQMRCVRDYASLTKDPSACELLMPSGYGLGCVGEAENHQLPCNTDVKPYSVYWRDGTTEHTVNVRECIHQNRDYDDLSSQCCAVARVAFLKDENDCTHLKTVPSVYDRCLYALAWKLIDSSYCAEISNQNAKSACIVQSNAIKKDPSICRGCTPPIESIEALEQNDNDL